MYANNIIESWTYAKAFDWLFQRKEEEISLAEKCVYIKIRQMGHISGNYYASQERIAFELGFKRRHIINCIKKLEHKKLIAVERNGKMMTNNYHFPDHPWMQNALKFNKNESKLKTIPDEKKSDVHYSAHEDFSSDVHCSAHSDVHSSAHEYISIINKYSNISLPHCEKFDRFWAAFPRKTGKQKSIKIWTKKNLDHEIEKILEDIKIRQQTEWVGRDKQFIPYPETYLNSFCWEDNPEDLKSSAEKAKPSAAHLGAI